MRELLQKYQYNTSTRQQLETMELVMRAMRFLNTSLPAWKATTPRSELRSLESGDPLLERERLGFVNTGEYFISLSMQNNELEWWRVGVANNDGTPMLMLWPAMVCA